MRFEHVLLDFYGTLLDIRTDERSDGLWARMAAWYEKHGAPWDPQDLKDGYFGTIRTLESSAARLREGEPDAHCEIRIEEVFGALFQQRGITPYQALLVDTMRYFRRTSTIRIGLYPGAAEFLEALRRNGQTVVLLSNAQHLFTMMELEDLAILPLFDRIYLSSDYGCRKPDPKFYQLPLSELHLDPARTVMIGNDSRCDVLGAKSVGLSAVYLQTSLSPIEPLPQEADLCLIGPDYPKLLDFLSQ